MIAKEFMKYNNWVVVGDVLKESKYAYKILLKLKAHGYNVVGVNPRSKSEEVIKSLKDIDHNIEVLDLCINPTAGMEIIKECKVLGINKVLIQPGAESDEILEYCIENGIIAIEGCALVEIANYF